MVNHVTVAEAADRLAHANRVLVVGCSGGGKTTLALRIAARFGLPHLSMDRDVYWLPGWRKRDRGEQRAILSRLVADDRWVMDGTGASTFDLRVPRADLIVWIRVPRRVALWGVARRVAANHGHVREGMAEGCPEQLPDRDFLRFIWRFERDTAPRIVAGIDVHGPRIPVAVLRSRRDGARLLAATPPLRATDAPRVG